MVVLRLLVLLAFGSWYFTSGKSRLNVDLDRITIATVTKGAFQETIPVNGVVLPISSIYLDATEGGRVEQKYVEDGTIMKKGEPILRLSNTDIELSTVTQQTNVYNLLTQNQIASNAAQQNTVTKLNQLTDVESLLREAKRVYELDKILYEKGAIGSQEFQQAKNNYDYYVQKMKLTNQIMAQDSISTAVQLNQNKQMLDRCPKSDECVGEKSQ